MTRTVAILTLTAAAALAGCSQEPAERQVEGRETGTPTTETVPPTSQTTQPAPAPIDTPAAPEPSPSPAATSLPTTIPGTIRGRWGLVPADCTSKLGDAKGLLTVSATQLKFYESVASLGTVKEAQGDRIRASFRYSGEGETWTQDVVLDVQDGGKTLVRRDYGPDALPGPFRYSRCR